MGCGLQAGPMHVPQEPQRHMMVPLREPPHQIAPGLVPQHQQAMGTHLNTNNHPEAKMVYPPTNESGNQSRMIHQGSRPPGGIIHQPPMASPRLVTPPGSIDRSLDPLHPTQLPTNQEAAKQTLSTQGVMCVVCGNTAAFLCSGCAKTPYCSGKCQVGESL